MKMHKSGATHVSMPPIKARVGFTLAEVLITLGIIGVVAAMTIPTLIANTNNAKFKSQYKKTLSTLNQAAKMAEAKYDINFAMLKAQKDCPNDKPETDLTMCALFNGTLAGATYMGTTNSVVNYNNQKKVGTLTTDVLSAWYTPLYQLADGAFVSFNFSFEEGCSLDQGESFDSPKMSGHHCIGFIDVNGAKLPNKEVRCSNGTVKTSTSIGDCIVRNNSVDMGDIFPIVFHDGVVEPLTDAARYVLQQAK